MMWRCHFKSAQSGQFIWHVHFVNRPIFRTIVIEVGVDTIQCFKKLFGGY